MNRNLLTVIIIISASYAQDRPIAYENNIPVYKCEQKEDICIFRNIQLNETDPRWQPYADNPIDIKRIEFHDSVIPILNGVICQKFTNLEVLDLENQNVKKVDADAFLGCENLKNITLSSNFVRKLAKETFYHTPNLKLIELSNNNIDHLDSDLFSRSYNLEILSLMENNLTQFSMDQIKNSPKLKDLNLHCNDLTDIDEIKMIQSFPNLEWFSIDYNQISCTHLVDLYQSLVENNINIEHSGSCNKTRFYSTRKLHDITCVPDMEWAAIQNLKQNGKILSEMQNVEMKLKGIDDKLHEQQQYLLATYNLLQQLMNINQQHYQNLQ